MDLSRYKVLLLDAANTIIHKPDIWLNILNVLKRNNVEVDEIELRRKHKLLSEIIHFPDRTSVDFYKTFNYELLLSLGIIANEQLLNEIFEACTYLPWKRFPDTSVLEQLPIKKAILSNFNTSLQIKLTEIFGSKLFDKVIGSEEEGFGKPDVRFYKTALDVLSVEPERVLYIGDSLKLDIVPARSVGMDTWLIDRDQNFKYFDKRMDSLLELRNIIG